MTGRYRRLSDWLYYFAVLPLLALLPARWGYALSRRQGNHVFRVQAGPRAKSVENMRSVLGERIASPRDETRLGFQIMTADDLDGFYFPRIGSRNIEDYVTFQGLEHLDRARSQGRGVVLFTAHFGATCMAAVSLGLKGYPIHPLAHDSRVDPTIEGPLRAYSSFKLARMKERIGGELVFIDLKGEATRHGQGVLRVYHLLQQGALVTMPIDVPPNLAQNTERVRFLDRPCRFPSGLVRFSYLNQSPIVPYFILRDEKDWHRQKLIVQAPIETSGELSIDLQRCVDRLDALVRRHPAHWFPWDSWRLFEDSSVEPINSGTVTSIRKKADA